MTERTPPQNLDDEMGVLGAMMNDSNRIDDVVAILPDSAAFCLGEHRTVYETLVRMHGEGVPIDLLLVSDRLKADGVTTIATSYLISLASSHGDACNAPFYARMVRDCWQRRRMITAALRLQDAAYDEAGGSDPASICGECCQELEAIAAGGRSDEVVEATATISELTAAWLLPKQTTIDTGMLVYDSTTGGLGRPSLTILAAKASTGKTSMALRMALAAAYQGVPTFFVSIETTARKIAERLVAMVGGRSVRALKTRCSPSDQAMTIQSVSEKIPKDMIFIADSLRGIHEISALSRAMVRRHGVGLIIVDHIQIMGSRGRHENRNLEVASLSVGLQALAKSTNACVLALSQLNRGVGESEPTLSSLRDSGALEQDADVVIFLHREAAKAGNTVIGPETIKMIVAKNRDGERFDATFIFKAATMDFVPDVPGHPAPGGGYVQDKAPF